MRKGTWLLAAVLVGALLAPQAVLAATGSFGTASNSTPAVAARNTASQGGIGGRFLADGYGARALVAEATWEEGGTYGVYGVSRSPTGRGIAGFNTARSGTAIGASGQSSSFFGRGVNGLALSSTGYTQGGFFETKSATGRSSNGLFSAGVYGWASNAGASGAIYGVHGRAESQDGIGVYGRAPGSGGVGVEGFGGAYGVTGNGNWAGVYGSSFADDAIGVYGGTGSITDRSFGVLSGSNLGAVGHVIAEQNSRVAGICTIPAGFPDQRCYFHPVDEDPSFPEGTTPVVVTFPLNSSPGDYHYWIDDVTRDGFRIRRDSGVGQGHTQAFNWIVIGIRQGLLDVPTARPARPPAD